MPFHRHSVHVASSPANCLPSFPGLRPSTIAGFSPVFVPLLVAVQPAVHRLLGHSLPLSAADVPRMLPTLLRQGRRPPSTKQSSASRVRRRGTDKQVRVAVFRFPDSNT